MDQRKMYANIIIHLSTQPALSQAKKLAREEGAFAVHFKEKKENPGFTMKVTEVEKTIEGWLSIDIYPDEEVITKDEITSEIAYLLAKDILKNSNN